MMSKMGYEPGKGLGANKQGRFDIVPMSTQRARRGLGLKVQVRTLCLTLLNQVKISLESSRVT